MRVVWVFAVCVLVGTSPLLSRAQDAPARSRVEFGGGGLFAGPVSFGTSSADLIRPDGSTLPLFRTENGLGPEIGLVGHVSLHVAGPLSFEGLGRWGRATLRSEIVEDLEGAERVTLEESVSRFSVEGAALWSVGRGVRHEWFLRTGAGWTRELAGASVLGVTGQVANLGVGVKYWWRQPAAGGGVRFGVRIEGQASVRRRGLTLGAPGTRVAPVITGSFIVGS